MKCLCLISAYCSWVIWVCHGLRDEGHFTHWLSNSGNGLCRWTTMGSNASPLPFDVDYKYEWTGVCGYYCIEIFFFFWKCFSTLTAGERRVLRDSLCSVLTLQLMKLLRERTETLNTFLIVPRLIYVKSKTLWCRLKYVVYMQTHTGQVHLLALYAGVYLFIYFFKLPSPVGLEWETEFLADVLFRCSTWRVIWDAAPLQRWCIMGFTITRCIFFFFFVIDSTGEIKTEIEHCAS